MTMAARFVALGATVGCSSEQRCGQFIGTPGSPAEALPIVLAGEETVDLTTGGTVRLERPPQGGHVVYTAVKVRNMSSCRLDLEGQFRDVVDGNLLGYERRQARAAARPDGWGQPVAPETSNYPNVALCPDTTPKDIQGQPILLELKATDSEGRVASASLSVVPRCEQADGAERALCLCECSADYFPGKCAGTDLDGGSSD
jgi:hypothetical protein